MAKNTKFANPLAALGGTFISPGHDLYPTAYSRFGELPVDPEVSEEEMRVTIGKRRTRTTAEKFFVPAPRKGREDARVARFPRRGTCHCLKNVVALPEPSTEDSERDGERYVDDGLSPVERIASLLEMRPSMAYTVFDTAVKNRRETILFAMVAACRCLTQETKRKVARQVRSFPTNSPFVGELTAALA